MAIGFHPSLHPRYKQYDCISHQEMMSILANRICRKDIVPVLNQTLRLLACFYSNLSLSFSLNPATGI